ncbi:MAG: agmatinase family protein [Actinomycetota bacterium]
MVSIPRTRRLSSLPPPPLTDPDFFTAAHWLAGGGEEPALAVLGVPFSGGSISGGRMDVAPAAIREALLKFSSWSSDFEVNLQQLSVIDVGELEPAADVTGTQERLSEASAAIGQQADVPMVVLGGDNSITVGAARGMKADGLLTFDAHHDCRDPSRGFTNGTPVRQLVDEGLEHVAQIGIHGFANAEPHARWAREHGVNWFSADAVARRGVDSVLEEAMRTVLGSAKRIWVDFDIDVLDRAFAPGAPAAMPGGLSPADLTKAAFTLGRDRLVVGIDIVEVDPLADVSQITVRNACAVFLAFACGVASR